MRKKQITEVLLHYIHAELIVIFVTVLRNLKNLFGLYFHVLLWRKGHSKLWELHSLEGYWTTFVPLHFWALCCLGNHPFHSSLELVGRRNLFISVLRANVKKHRAWRFTWAQTCPGYLQWKIGTNIQSAAAELLKEVSVFCLIGKRLNALKVNGCMIYSIFLLLEMIYEIISYV